MMNRLIILFSCLFALSCSNDGSQTVSERDLVVDGIHQQTGLHDDPNLNTIIGACTPCHSAQLITQNRATREGWEGMIKWMQKTQNLMDLGEAEPIILDYLAKYYAPEETGRRKNIDVADIEWYILEQ
jgi:hypothetical protein